MTRTIIHVRLPIQLIKKIDKLVEKGLFQSRTDIIKYALIQLLLTLSNTENAKELITKNKEELEAICQMYENSNESKYRSVKNGVIELGYCRNCGIATFRSRCPLCGKRLRKKRFYSEEVVIRPSLVAKLLEKVVKLCELVQNITCTLSKQENLPKEVEELLSELEMNYNLITRIKAMMREKLYKLQGRVIET